MKSNEFFKQTEMHNGQQPEKTEEQLIETAELFTELVQKILRENEESISHGSYGEEYSYVQTRFYVDETDNKNYTSVVVQKFLTESTKYSYPFPLSERTLEDITVQQIRDGKGRDILSYRLKADGVVRRWNGGDMFVRIQQEKLGIEDGNLLGAIEKAQEDLVNADIPVLKVEEELGYQNQPVLPDEIRSLAELLKQN